MTRDLPAELWLEILSYLPPGHARKLFGINRFLTEKALDEIYYSFTLNNGSRRVVSSIQRLTEPMHAQRIRRLDIYSCFLAYSSEADEALITRDRSRLPFTSPRPKSSKSILRAMRNWLRPCMVSSRTPSSSRLSGQRQNHIPNPQCVQPDVLTALSAALSRWLQLEEINFFLDDFVSMPTFSDFLIDLWSQRGMSIRTLNIDTSICGLFDFLEIFSTRLTPFPNLECLSMKLLASQKYVSQRRRVEIGNKLAAFVESHKHSLHTLIISEPIFVKWVEISTLTQGLGYLPKLKKIDLPIVAEQASHSGLEYLERFLNLNAHNLECLLMEYTHSSPLISSPRDAYQSLLNNVLPKLCFPLLSELDMDVYADARPRLIPFRLPPLRLFAPNLKKLTLKGSIGYLTSSELMSLLENLSTGARLLTSFHFKLWALRPGQFDQLALNLPMLESLSIIYAHISVDTDGPFKPSVNVFCKKFDHEYANWSLKYLRLAQASVCEDGHPDPRLSGSVAKLIPGLEINDNSRSCNCISYNDVLLAD